MHSKAVRIVAILFAVGFIASSCTEPPASPTVPSLQADRDGPGVQTLRLVPCVDLPFSSRTQTIGSRGGVISVGPHQLKIPRGALERRTEITMTVSSGRGVNEVKLEPEGLRFDDPVSLTMSYANCDISEKKGPYRIAYVDDELNFLSFVRSRDKGRSRRVTGSLKHFSRYVVADYVIAW